jgi:hypothetical protein
MTRRWIVVVDDEREAYPTRREAREAAAWHRRHPANRDISRNTYRNVDGIPRIYREEAHNRS